MKTVLVWCVFASVVSVPVFIAATSPLLNGREGVYIVGGMAGVVGLALLLVQPLLASGYLPAISTLQERRWHRRIGIVLVASVALHIFGLYLTSPDDLTDALLLVAPTPFSVYGVLAMWGLILTVILVAIRTRLSVNHNMWKVMHNVISIVVVLASVTHALMIEGAMSFRSKLILCICIVGATVIVIAHLRIIKPMLNARARNSENQ